MKTYTFSGMATKTARFDYEVTVTAEDISEYSVLFARAATWRAAVLASRGEAIEPEVRKYSVEDVEAWTDEQVRAYVKEHMYMLKDKVDAAFVDADEEYDDDMSFDVDEVIFEEVEG